MARILAVALISISMLGCSNPEKTAEINAVTNCREMLRNAAKNPSSAEIPGPDVTKKHENYRSFSWTHGKGLRFMNGFGAMIDSAATCETSLDGTHVKNLLIDDDLVFQDAGSLAVTAQLNAAIEAAEKHRAGSSSSEIKDAAQQAVDAANAAADAAEKASKQ